MHVNVGLVLKFMPNYMLNPAEYPEIGTRLDAVDDKFFSPRARPAAPGACADWKPAFERFSRIDNVATFYGQARKFADFLMTAGPDAEQQKDLDFLLTVGQIFPLIAYGQLILEQAELTGLDDDAVAQIRHHHPRLLVVRRRSARQADGDPAAAGLGARRHRRADARSGALRPDVEPCAGLQRRVRDEPLAIQGPLGDGADPLGDETGPTRRWGPTHSAMKQGPLGDGARPTRR